MNNKLVLAITFFATHTCMSATLEEFLSKTPDEKVAILISKPDKFLGNPQDLLKLYTASLNDESAIVRKAAARSSAFLVMGLQAAKTSGNDKLPVFTALETDDFQRSLVAALEQENSGSRIAAFTALAYSSEPMPKMENMLLLNVVSQKDESSKGEMMVVMAQAGYNSEKFVSEVSKLFERTSDSSAARSAGRVLGHLKSESALDLLISLAVKPNQAQRHAIQALGAYGAKAAKAKPALESLMKDQGLPEDIRNLVGISLETINTDKPQASNLHLMKLTTLWPLPLGSSPNDAPKKITPVVNPPPTVQTPASKKAPSTTPASSTPSEESTSSTPWSIIVILSVAAIGLLWLLLKRRS